MSETTLRSNKHKTHCKHGHAFSDANTLLERDAAGSFRRRRCRACRKRPPSKNLREATVRKLIQAIDEGQTLARICGGMHGHTYVGGKILSVGAFHAFCATRPRLGERLIAKLENNRKVAFAGMAYRKRLLAAPAVLRNDGVDIFEAIACATARLHESIRDDVMGSMFVAASEGRLKISDVSARVREFVAAHNRMFSQYVPIVGGLMRSTDQRLFDDGQMTLGDTVARGLWDSD